MFCYRDRTYCDFENCSRFANCERAYDEIEKAKNTQNFPVCMFAEKPECFKEKSK